MQSTGRSRRSNTTTSTTTAAKNSVIAGSVWENRMEVDEVKGGIKVFNGSGDQNNVVGGGIDHSGNRIQVYRRRIQSNGGGGEIGKSKRTLKPENVDGIDQRSPIQFRKSKSDKIEKTPQIPVIKKTRSYEEQRSISKDLGAVKEREMILNNVSQSRDQENVIDYDCDDEEEEEGSNLIKNRDSSESESDVKEVNIDQEPQKKLNVIVNEEDNKTDQMSKELVVLPSNLSKKLLVPNLKNSISKFEKAVIQDEKKEIQNTSIPISSGVSKQPPPQPVKYTEQTHPKIPPSSYEFQKSPESQNKLQNLVDLVMWRDVSKSALVFGFGTFLIFSTSFTKDFNFRLCKLCC